MSGHVWAGPKGEDWTPEAASDRCAECGHTPDAHGHRLDEWARNEAREIVYRIAGPGLDYHTRRRREKELALRLIKYRDGAA